MDKTEPNDISSTNISTTDNDSGLTKEIQHKLSTLSILDSSTKNNYDKKENYLTKPLISDVFTTLFVTKNSFEGTKSFSNYC